MLDVLVIGAGPAGLAAGASLARYGRSVRILDSRPAGGQARRLPLIENYPGFPAGVPGARLMARFVAGARRWGARIESRDVLSLRRGSGGFCATTVTGDLEARSVVAATGCEWRSLGLDREWGLPGVLHGGVSEAPRLSGRVCVVGGGEAAAYQALAASATAEDVAIVMRARALKAHALLRRRVSDSPRIRVLTGLAPWKLLGRKMLTAVELRPVARGRPRRVRADWLLILVGKRPRTSVARRARGPGLFWAGDVRLGLHRQVAAAAGDGIRVAMDCERFLNDLDGNP